MKKQLNRQAISFSLVLFLSWFSFASFGIIPEIIDMIAGDTNTFKYAVPEQMMALAPAAIMIAITLALNYILKPDLSRSLRCILRSGLLPF